MLPVKVHRPTILGVLLLFCVSSAVNANRIQYADSWEDYCPHTICEGVENGRFIDNPLNCAAFFQCRNGRAYSGECLNGTWFNYEDQKCDVPWNIRCDAEASEIIELECVEDEEPHYTINCRSNNLEAISHPFDCNMFYLCVNGLPMLRSCAPGLHFNIDTNQCMKPEEANCRLTECPPYNLPLTFLPSNRSCSEYSICYFGEPILHLCADGLHWDQENEWCTDPEKVQCDVSG